MPKYSFQNDYSEGAHPSILGLMQKTNFVQEQGYGKDTLSAEAAALIRKTINHPEADIHFVSGGTQANRVVLASMLKPYESIIAGETAHIHMHETGAVEATGHKINTIETVNGKLTPDKIKTIMGLHTDEHMVRPKVVFISNATELGTVYTKSQLEHLSATCQKLNLYLYLDGARLGAALSSATSDLVFEDLKNYVDAYYIGGTKNGAVVGEAIVINNESLKENFRYHLKQHGALLAKGRVLGVQFYGLFKDNLFFDLARHANIMASRLSRGLEIMGFGFLEKPETNQIFPVLPNTIIPKLQDLYGFYVWKRIDEKNSAVRLVTSWATKKSHIDAFLKDLKQIENFV